MSKKLNITNITNELEGSAFFPSKKPTPISSPPPPASDSQTTNDRNADITRRPAIEPKQPAPERPNAPSVERTSGKRIITRNSFEIYEDQMDALRRISYQQKMEGKLGSMSGMVREAIDKYLLNKTTVK